jgi:uncharacterized membrane-anchored protein
MNATAVPTQAYTQDVSMLVSLLQIVIVGVFAGAIMYICGVFGYQYIMLRRSSSTVKPVYVAMSPLGSSAV